MASSQLASAVCDGKILIHQMIKLTLSHDHRIVDGGLGARFVSAITQTLATIGLLKLLGV
ncbi:MAG: 2-oxo acid dehydrogenase subunit E2 [Verrucomicrobia bacterium]|nr:2-oxo acid dehydrogenase subunit E2 [Verrucomicrobiota bacterium]